MSDTHAEPGRSAFALVDVNDMLARGGDSASGDAGNPVRMLEQMQLLNARLEHQNQQLTALYEIGRTLASTLDMHEIYWTMYRQIAQGCWELRFYSSRCLTKAHRRSTEVLALWTARRWMPASFHACLSATAP